MNEIARGVTSMFTVPLFYSGIEEKLRANAEKDIIKMRNSGEGNQHQPWYWQSEDNLYEDERFHELSKICKIELGRVFDYLNISRDNIRINNMWAGITKDNYFHQQHIHPNSFYSGLIYIKSNEKSAPTIFNNPINELIVPEYIERNEYTASMYYSLPIQGHMVIWPSWIPHQVDNDSNIKETDERIAIAFTAIPVGKVTQHTIKYCY